MECVLGCEEFFMELMRSGDFLPILAIAMGCLVGTVAILSGAISGTIKTRNREQTKRELAAYVAEGSMSADQAAALLNAGRSKCGNGPDAIC